MNIKDVAALVQIRNYAFSVREDRNIFRGEQYHKVTAQIARIDKFLSTVLTEEDLVKMVIESQPVANVESSIVEENALAKKKTPKIKKAEKHITMELPKPDSQIPLNFDSESKSDDSSDYLSDAEADALLAKRIAEEKAKIAKRKTGS